MELHLEERELSHEKQWEKNAGPPPKSRVRAGEGRGLCILQCRVGARGVIYREAELASFLLHPTNTYCVRPGPCELTF